MHFLLLNAILALNAGTAREIPGCPPVRVVPHRNEKRAYMKLFYDTSFLLSYPSGIPVYTVSLLNALAALDQTLTIHSGTTSMDLRHHLKLRKLERQYCPEVKITRHMKLFPKAFFSSGMFPSLKHCLSFSSGDYDLLHFTGSVCPPWIPVTSLSNAVITVHDMFTFYAEETIQNPFYRYVREQSEKQLTECAAILTNSNYTKNEIRKFLNIPEGKIFVTPLAIQSEHLRRPADTAFLRQKGLSRYFLSVGALEVKNHDKLIAAFRRFQKTPEYRRGDALVIAGHHRAPDMEHLIDNDTVFFLENVSPEILASLYQNAQGFFLISNQEGFGIPLLEAMTAGCPACHSPGSGMDEIGRDATYRVLPTDQDALVRQFAIFSESSPVLREKVGKGLRIAGEYSWRRTAEKTLEVYRRVLSGELRGQ